MRAILGGGLVLVLVLAAGSPAQDKDKGEKIDGKKLLGKWELSGGDAHDKGIGGTLEFTKDGKLKLEMRKGELKKGVDGSYKLDGNKLAMTLKKGDMEKTDDVTVTKLTDEALVLKDDRGKLDEFKRVKEKGKDKK